MRHRIWPSLLDGNAYMAFVISDPRSPSPDGGNLKKQLSRAPHEWIQENASKMAFPKPCPMPDMTLYISGGSRRIGQLGEVLVSSQNTLVRLMAAVTLFALTESAQAEDTSLVPISFHEIIGEVVDSAENSRLSIFGSMPGFEAAKLYPHGIESYRLHILRNRDGTAQILLKEIHIQTLISLRRGISQRLSSSESTDLVPENALFSTQDTDWSDPSILQKLTLRDGSVLHCRLQEARFDTLIVETLSGLRLEIPDDQILRVARMEGEIREGEFRRYDPNGTRLFFAPTGRRLERGRGYFADYFLFFPSAAIGVTDYLSLAGGFSIIPGASSQIHYVAPRVRFPLSRTAGIAGGLLHLAIPEDTDDITLGYAVLTIGDAGSAVTVGGGAQLQSDSDHNAILLVGGKAQLSNRTKLISSSIAPL